MSRKLQDSFVHQKVLISIIMHAFVFTMCL